MQIGGNMTIVQYICSAIDMMCKKMSGRRAVLNYN